MIAYLSQDEEIAAMVYQGMGRTGLELMVHGYQVNLIEARILQVAGPYAADGRPPACRTLEPANNLMAAACGTHYDQHITVCHYHPTLCQMILKPEHITRPT